MLLRIGIFAAFAAVVVGQPNSAAAAGRLAAFRAARVAAAENAALAASTQTPAVRPVALQPAAPVQPMQVAPAIAPVTSAVTPCTTCCPQPCLIYRHRGHHRACCGCAPQVETILTAINPCTCCPVEIPVCVPACCNCAPAMSCHGGLLCAGVVDFDWSCGYRVTVRFKHNGDVVVVTRG